MLIRLLLIWTLNSLALIAVANFVPGIHVDGFAAAFIAAFVLGLVNTLIRPILLVLTLPVTLLTLGLFIFVVNAICFALTAGLVAGFDLDGFFAALLGSIVVTIVSWVLNALLVEKEDRRR